MSRGSAGKLFNDSISHRDYRAWEVVQGAPGTSRCDLASTHVKEFPQCEHRIPAETILKICEEAAKERPNLEWIEKIKSDAAPLSHLNKSKDQLTSLAEKLQGLRQELNSLPHPETVTEKVQADKRDTQEQIDTRLSEVDRAIGDEKWAKFQREYYDLMIKKSIREAASHLAGWDSKDPRCESLRKHFRENVVPILKGVAQEAKKNRQWSSAIKVVEAVEQHPDSLKPGLLDDERLHGLQGIVEDLKDDEDKSRYEDILNNKPQCRDQIRAYLAAGTTHRMERSVAGYEAYLNQRDSALDLKLHLSEILWGGATSGYTHEVGVTVDADKHIQGRLENVAHGRSGQVGEPLPIRKKLDDTVKLSVTITRKAWWPLIQGDSSAGSAVYEGSAQGLDARIIDLSGSDNKVTFKLEGMPVEPPMPPWSKTP